MIEQRTVKSVLPKAFGDSHRYKNNVGEISLVYPCVATLNEYEIYCVHGNLFTGTERYPTLGATETRISELLHEKITA